MVQHATWCPACKMPRGRRHTTMRPAIRHWHTTGARQLLLHADRVAVCA
jgi:hypothetical protein